MNGSKGRTFLISDTHFSHKNIITFKDGLKPLRPFDTMEEMNEHMIECWNNVVTDEDTVINLGDVVFAQSGFECLGRLRGQKRLLFGNHERHKLEKYLDHFISVHAYMEIGDIILSHIPVHDSQMDRWKACIHGHLHSKNVMLGDGNTTDDRYFCVSVEQINYTPILLSDVIDIFRNRGVLPRKESLDKEE
jgi:calcineurin-like phosphoesterase family protein